MMANRNECQRTWCARYQYQERKPFTFGTAVVRSDAPMHEVESELLRMLACILPQGAEMPILVSLMPGSLIFIPGEDWQ
jgi:hypothetical protein